MQEFAHVSEIKRLHAGARYSEASIHAGVVYLAGQVAVGGGTTIESQVAEVLASIDRLLAEAGSSKARILMAQGDASPFELAFILNRRIAQKRVDWMPA